MRFGLVVLGIIFLVLGGVLNFYPSQTFSAQTNVAAPGESNVVNSSAMLNIPVEWSYALLIMGALFLLIGLVMPGPTNTKVVSGVGVRGPRGYRGKVRTKVRRARSPVRSARRPVKRTRGRALGTTSVTTTTTRTR